MGAICSCYPSCEKLVLHLVTNRLLSTQYEVPVIKSSPPNQEQSSDSPFFKTAISKTNPLNLIHAFENEPLVSLEEALAPLYGKIDRLLAHIQEAKSKLTRDESAAIHVCTVKWGDSCLYDHLKAVRESNKQSELKPWFKHFNLFKTAFHKLFDAKEEIWQGNSYDERLKDEVKSVCGKLVNDYAAFKSNGVSVWLGTKLGVSDIEVIDGSGSVTFHLAGPPPPETPKESSVPEKHCVLQ